MSWPDFWIKKTWKTRLLSPLGKLVCQLASNRWQKFQAAAVTSQSTQQVSSQELSDLHTLEKSLPVCVVGNIVVGGTGKTPFIIWLVKELQQRGIKVGIVSRGYGGKSKQWPQSVTAESDPHLVGDEPVMLAKNLAVPVAVSPKRQQAVELLSQTTDCDWLISDDGLQHYAMPRAMQLVLVDAQRLFGNQLCMPAGPMREPLAKIAAVDAVILNGPKPANFVENLQTDLGEELPNLLTAEMQLQPVCLRNLLDPKQTVSLQHLKEAKLFAMAGIGNPQRFFDSLQDLGAQLTAQAFPDHHAYNEAELRQFLGMQFADSLVFTEGETQSLNNALLMTEKDAVKCLPLAQSLQAKNWWYLQISPQVDSALLEHIIQKMQAAK